MYKVKKINSNAREEALRKWNSIAKPMHGLGIFEDMIADIAGIQGTANVDIGKRCVLVMCADNGVVCEGVTQTGQEVTAIVTENFSLGRTSVCAMARNIGAEVIPVDVGVARDVEGAVNRKIVYGTNNMLTQPAMTRADAYRALQIGVDCVGALADGGCKIICTGEMGIGNTTTAAAVTSVLLSMSARAAAGKGAGLTDAGLERKISVIERSIAHSKPDKNDALDVLSKVGGCDIAALAGVFIGGAVYGAPVVIDGFISAAAALCAYKICPESRDFMLASHVSRESAAADILRFLGKEAPIDARMCLGEGTGAVMLLGLLDAALCVYNEMSSFEDINVERYKELK